MTAEQLTEVRALCEAATDGPWTIEPDRNDQQNIYSNDEWIALLPHQCVSSIEQQRVKDAAFIAASRSLVPALLDENEALRTALRVARSELAIAASYADARDISIGLRTHARSCADAIKTIDAVVHR